MIDAKSAPVILVAAAAGAAAMALFSPPAAAPPPPALQTASVERVAPAAMENVARSSYSAMLKRGRDGHFWAQADVDGVAIDFMVDTGASTVALTYDDAKRMGLKPETLDYRWSISTAGGETKGASVLIDEIRIGQVRVRNVEAMVLGDSLEQSLLGMTFLGELYSYEFRRNSLIIRQ